MYMIFCKKCDSYDINVKNGYTMTPYQNHNNVKCEDLDNILHQSCDSCVKNVKKCDYVTPFQN
jgi:hypothetical protein